MGYIIIRKEKNIAMENTFFKRKLVYFCQWFFSLSFGLMLFLKALETGQVAKVSMLVAISPVLMLPFIWFQTKKLPALGAWLGAILVVLSS